MFSANADADCDSFYGDLLWKMHCYFFI